MKSGYVDGHRWNFAFIKSGPHKGKLAIYDTEPLATFNFRHFASKAQKIGYPIEEAKYAEREDLILGNTRNNDLECAKFAIKESIDATRGLQIPADIRNPVAQKFIKKIEQEKRSNYWKIKLITYSPVITAIAAIGVQYLL